MNRDPPPSPWRAAAAAVLNPARRLHAGLVRRWLVRRGPVAAVVACRTVVVAPHHDDETIGCGGLIALKRSAGASVSIVVLTDGSDYRGRDPAAPPSAVADARRREAVAAAAALGVPADHVHFPNAPDGRLATLEPPARDALVRALAGHLAGAAEVYVTHRHDGHPDHEAAYRLVRDAVAVLPSQPAVLQYPIWMTWLAPIGLRLRRADMAGLRVVPIHSVIARKTQAMAAYPSQLATLPRGFLAAFAPPFELFFAECPE